MMAEHVENRNEVYYIPGTRISLDSIVYAFRNGPSPDSIREDFNGVSLPHITVPSISTWTIKETSMPTWRPENSNGGNSGATALLWPRGCGFAWRTPAVKPHRFGSDKDSLPGG